MLIALIALILASLALCIYAVLAIRPSELQVVTHYTAFGSTNFYRDKWYYLVGFVVFGFLNGLVYAALGCKLFIHKGRELAVPLVWLGVITALIALAIVSQVLKIAALS